MNQLNILVSLLNSNFFIGLITLIVGFVAFWIYNRQKRDSKRNAANVVLLEIEDAERQIEKIDRERPLAQEDDTAQLMKTNSWDKNKYLFVRDFDRNEWDKITAFYRKCQAFDAAINLSKVSMENNQQQVRANMQRVLIDYAKTHVDALYEIKNSQHEDAVKQEKINLCEGEYSARRSDYYDLIVGEKSNIATYTPKQAEFDAKKALNNLDSSLSLTSAGSKLKLMVNKKSLLERLRALFNK